MSLTPAIKANIQGDVWYVVHSLHLFGVVIRHTHLHY